MSDKAKKQYTKRYTTKPANMFGKVFADWNQSQKKPFTFAELSELTGMSRPLVYAKLSGTTGITIDEALMICEVTGAPFNKLSSLAKSKAAEEDAKQTAEVVLTA